jgi:hypothetical protein
MDFEGSAALATQGSTRMDRQTAMDKARKLMRLGQSANEHEAAAALAAAQAILDRHEILQADLGDLDADHEPDGELGEHDWQAGETPWKRALGNAIARANGCTLYYMGGTCYVVGRRALAERALDIIRATAAEVDRLGAQYARGKGRRAGRSFRLGAVYAIRQQLRAEAARTREAMAGTVSETALAVVGSKRSEAKAWMHRHHPHMRTVQQRTSVDARSYAAGQRAGEGLHDRSRRPRVGSRPRIGGGQ